MVLGLAEILGTVGTALQVSTEDSSVNKWCFGSVILSCHRICVKICVTG